MSNDLDRESRTELMADVDVAMELTGGHDSDICTQGTDGRPCWMCEWANSAERRQALKQLAEAGVFSARPSTMSIHDLGAIRRAILTVIDRGACVMNRDDTDMLAAALACGLFVAVAALVWWLAG